MRCILACPNWRYDNQQRLGLQTSDHVFPLHQANEAHNRLDRAKIRKSCTSVSIAPGAIILMNAILTPAPAEATSRNGTPKTSSLAPAPVNPQPGFHDWTHMVFTRLSHRYQNGNGADLLAWAVSTFGSGLSIGTGLGASGIVLMDMALRIHPDVDIFYIDTGYFFPETYQLITRLEQHYQRSLRRVSTNTTIEQQEKRFGPQLYNNDPNLCCHIRKVSPLKQALADSTAWVSALRHDQSPTRKNVPMVQWNDRYNLVKIAPMAHWTEADVWEYIHEYHLPYNELHDKGYPSIGC
jgi:phosphoadenosine phosphosulfate reductase